MLSAFVGLVVGLALLVWSADRFVDASVSIARYLGMTPLLIGMVIVGFGTSAPELTVSALAAMENNAGIALGNVYGSNICNIALILGVSALVRPIVINPRVFHKEMPLLLLVTTLAWWQVSDGELSRLDAAVLLLVFTLWMVSAVWESRQQQNLVGDAKEADELATHLMPLRQAMLWLPLGLLLLIGSARLLVWAAVNLAHAFGVSDLVIGLTIVAVGTSLPELASSVLAVRKGQHDIALGNILGSNLFNTLMVAGVTGL
ncbi:MAG TPA: calcium/sodium antiporter, partial [Pseudomonadales bacterium]|nr:calcium/sodium antiporter [Pseudomonadales bacterium]